MHYQRKVFLSFATIAFLSGLLVIVATFFPVRDEIFRLLSSNVLSVAATTAAFISGDEHEKIRTAEDRDSETYHFLQRELQRARDANRRKDFWIQNLYTLRALASDRSTAVFVIDTDENPKTYSEIGSAYLIMQNQFAFDPNRYQAPRKFVIDQWGTWLTANAPIRNREGVAVGAVAADVPASEVHARLLMPLCAGLGAMVISILFAAVASAVVTRRITRPLMQVRDAMLRICRGDLQTAVPVQSRDEFGELKKTLNEMVSGLRERERLKTALACYVSEDVLADVLASGKLEDLRGQRKKVTALFADIRGFTSFTEALSPEEVVQFLNEYFEKMIQAIFRNQGSLNKLVGDGLVGLFGAVRDDQFQEEHAVRAAIEMQRALEQLKEKWSTSRHAAGIAKLDVGVGINTGLAIVGNVGSKQHMEFTAIGDSVNLASRLEAMTKEIPGVHILVSEYTYVTIRNDFSWTPVGTLSLRGKADTIRTFTLSTNCP